MIALSTGSLYNYGMTRVFSLAAEAGFDGIEVLIDDRWDTRQPDYIRQQAEAHKLVIASLHTPFVPRIQGWSTDPVERVKNTAALAHELDVKTIVVHLPARIGSVVIQAGGRWLHLPILPLPFGKTRRWMEDKLDGFEAEQDLNLCVENMPAVRLFGRRINRFWWNTLDEWVRFPHLTLDTTHWATWGIDPLSVYQRARANVSHIHLSNYNRQEHRRLEDGHLRLDALLQLLRADGYAGVIVVELDPSALSAKDRARALEQLRNQVAFCREHLGLQAHGPGTWLRGS